MLFFIEHYILDTCTSMLISALFTIAKTWKQTKCPMTDEWIKMWYIYTIECHSVLMRWMNLEPIRVK